jgi:Tol biopolymer transport system component/tRNA A-37 threonylcarbamoyl transferase component Bud32
MPSGGDPRDKRPDESTEDLAVARTIPSDPGGGATRFSSSPSVAPSSPSASRADAELLGGRYEVLGELGRGAEGIVYRARDIKADAIVALKLLPHDDDSEARLQRFRRELQMARKVTHPNVVRIYDLVELPGRFGLSMELVDGEPLDDRIARGPLGAQEIVALALDLARALAAAHAAGVLHRDLKPGNVLLRRRDGSAVVTDFGVSRALEDDDAPVSSASDGRQLRLTATGAIIGTPLYMAPEQLDGGGDVGPAADVFAFGLVVFEAATGRRLHDANTLGELRRLRRESRAPPLGSVRRGLPRRLSDAVNRALSPGARDRFPSGVELLAALDPLAKESWWTPRRVGVVGLAAVAGAAALAFALAHRQAHVSSTPAPAATVRSPFPLRLADDRRRITHGECEEGPVFTRDGRAVLYDGTVGPDSFIYRLDLDGGEPVQLTRVLGWDTDVQPSPDGTRFAFGRNEGAEKSVYVAPLDGHEPPRMLVRDALSPNWSRDGHGLWVASRSRTVEVDAETGTPLRTLEAPPGVTMGPTMEAADGVLLSMVFRATETNSSLGTFSADGAFRTLLDRPVKMAVLTPDRRDAIVEVARVDNGAELIDAPLDGSPAMQIPAGGLSPDGSMAFSADGKRLVWSTCGGKWNMSLIDAGGHFVPFAGEEGETTAMDAIPGTGDVAIVSTRGDKPEPWVVDASGQRPARVIPVGSLRPTSIAVSHDGSLFAIASEHGIYVGSLEGDPHLRQLTSDPVDAAPSFRFGDRQLLFTRILAERGHRVMTVPVGGGDSASLLDAGSDAASSSPNEDRVVYLAGSGGTLVPMIWDARSGASRALSSALATGTYSSPRFSPDGRRVALVRSSGELVEVDVATGSVVRAIDASKAQELYDPTYSRAGLLILRLSWSGNLWMADLLP